MCIPYTTVAVPVGTPCNTPIETLQCVADNAEVGHKPWFMLIHKMQSHYESMKET